MEHQERFRIERILRLLLRPLKEEKLRTEPIQVSMYVIMIAKAKSVQCHQSGVSVKDEILKAVSSEQSNLAIYC
jgi:hypothetical protein